MKISMLPRTLFLASLLLIPLCAQENKEKFNCTEIYSLCCTKCEILDNSFSQCIEKCDEKFDQCSEEEEKTAE